MGTAGRGMRKRPSCSDGWSIAREVVLDTAVAFGTAYKSYMTLVTGVKGVSYRLGLPSLFKLFLAC
jgi:hypothetical protein